MNEQRIEINKRSKGNFSLSEGYSFNIVAVSKPHKDKVKVKLQGRFASGELEHSVENPNDSPIFIEIIESRTP
jgi:hypothetical protein